MNNKATYFFKSIMPTIFILGLQTFLSAALGFLMVCKKAADYKSGSYMDFMEECMDTMLSADFNLGVMLVYVVITLLLFSFWYKKEFGQEKKGEWRISVLTKKPVPFVLGLIVISFGAQYLCMYVTNLLAMAFPEWLINYEKIMDAIGLADEISLPLVLYVVLLGPICEEITYRGLTMGFAKKYASFWGANIIQAVLFAGLHMNPLQSAYTFFIGLLFGYFVHKSGSLLTGIVLHIAFNAVGVFGNSLIIAGENQMQSFLILFGALVATYAGFRAIRDGY